MIQRRKSFWFSLLLFLAALGAFSTAGTAAPSKATLLITTSSDGELAPCG